MDRPESLLEPWTNFYVIIGSAAAALTGLMFVVITLISGSERPRSPEATATFSTPTVVHFSAALLVAAILTAPWHVLLYPRVLLGTCGLYGIVYVLSIAYRIRRMPAYNADTEDWSWHTMLPLFAYTLIFFGALTLTTLPIATYAFSAAVVLMLFLGIHNAWDLVTFVAVVGAVKSEQDERSDVGESP